MTFQTANGTRGARQPGGLGLRLFNALSMWRARRSKPVEGKPVTVVLTSIGKKSGEERRSPLAGFPEPGGSWLVVASAAGAARNPAWYYNLGAHPDRARLEAVGTTIDVSATELHGPEREQAWQRITAEAPGFADYQTKTDREIPVIRLTPR